MKKVHVFSLFIALQVFLIFFYIYWQSRVIGHTFTKQRLEETSAQLRERRQKLEHQLSALKSRSAIKKYAQELGMENMRLSSLRKLYEPTV